MKVIGLTGGIGSGKTTVANFFKDLGIGVYIADSEAKKLMNDSPEVRKDIIALFGDKAYSQKSLDRKFLANQVFKNKSKLQGLNNIVHPAVRKDFELWKSKQEGHYVIYEAAILFESGGDKICDKTILVIAERERRIEWLQKRDSSTLQEIEARMANQWTDKRKKEYADFVIENEILSETLLKVLEIHQLLLRIQ